MKSICVFGAGLVGGPMVKDLARDGEFFVRVVDISQASLDHLKDLQNVECLCADLGDVNKVKDLAAQSDLCLNALPGHLGFQTFQAIIEAGIDVVDIAFFAQDPLPLDGLAKDKGVTALMDMGVAPGMSNVLLGAGFRELDKTDSAKIYVGGLPLKKVAPWEYKAPFSPCDVIQEYTRPARYVKNGKLVTVPALTQSELIAFEKTGELEGAITDGLRSLVHTLKISNMSEWTLRYPGHYDKIRKIDEARLFDEQPVVLSEFNKRMRFFEEAGWFKVKALGNSDQTISPLEWTSRLLMSEWFMTESDRDLTVMRVVLDGEKEGQKTRLCYDLYDEYDEDTKVHSMARTTGYAATMALRMLARGMYKKAGVIVPEMIGLESAECVDFLLKGLRERGVEYVAQNIPLSQFD